MNKTQLITALRDKEKITIQQAESYLNSLTEIISNQVLSGDVLKILGFGRFFLKKTKARNYRNIQTGEKVLAESRELISFKQLNIGYVHKTSLEKLK
jgi:nucleoid DNA-binding protein